MPTSTNWTMQRLVAQLPNSVVLDTETTGLTGEVIDLAIINGADGRVLFNSLLMHSARVSIEPKAEQIHHISEATLRQAHAPTFAQAWPALAAALQGKSAIIAYNAAFDMARFEQSARAAGLTRGFSFEWVCAMQAYARYWGAPNRRGYGGFAWQTLDQACAQQGVACGGQAHRAIVDSTATYHLLLSIARNIARRTSVQTYRY